MLKIADYLYVDKKYIVRQIIEDLIKSINEHILINHLTKINDSYLYIDDGKLILVHGSEDHVGIWREDSREVISDKKSDIDKYYTAYNLMQLYKVYP